MLKNILWYLFDLTVAVILATVAVTLVTWSWPFASSPEIQVMTFFLAVYIAQDFRNTRAEKAKLAQ